MTFQFNLSILRVGLYAALVLFSFVLFCLTAARLNSTNQLGFYEPIIAELLVATLFTIPWSLYINYAIYKRFEHPYFATFMTEIAGLSFLWLFWIVGAGTASTGFDGVSGCQASDACRLISAILAFAWLGWLTLTLILGLAVLFSFANRAFKEPLHGRWDPRQTIIKA